MHDVFISHSSKDKKRYVYKLRDYLEEYGHNVWLDEDNILVGDSIPDEIKNGIENSLCVVLVLTEHFFESNWATLETGITMANPSAQIIPIIADISDYEVAKKFPFLLSRKYLSLEHKNLELCAMELSTVITKLRERRLLKNPLDYHKKVRELNNFDSPSTNRLSILITEYEQICKISIDTGIIHASKIAESIVNDLYERVKHPKDPKELRYDDTIEILLDRHSGLTLGVCEHLKSLINVFDSRRVTFYNDKDKKVMTDLSLASVLDWYLIYISAILRKNNTEERIDTVWHDEFTYQDFLDMYEIDKSVLRNDLIASPETTYNWYNYNNFSHLAVRSSVTKKIIGYFTLFPITDELYEEIKSGNFKDNDLGLSGIRRYDFPDFYKLYVACVCIHPDYQNTTAFHKLYTSLIQMMYNLASERDVYITEIITEASTPQGLKLCKIMGFQKLMNTNLDTEIFGATLLPPSLRLNSNFGHKLINFYRVKYTEMKEFF